MLRLASRTSEEVCPPPEGDPQGPHGLPALFRPPPRLHSSTRTAVRSQRSSRSAGLSRSVGAQVLATQGRRVHEPLRLLLGYPVLTFPV